MCAILFHACTRQVTLYRFVLEEREPNYVLYLAVPEDVLKDTFQQPLGRLMVSKAINRLVGFDPVEETITQWIS